MADLPFDSVDYVVCRFVPGYQHFNRLYKTLVMEVHVLLYGLYFFDYALS